MEKERKRSWALFERAKGLIPGGVNSPVRAFGQMGGTPIFIKRAAGNHIEDVDGNIYVDFCQSWGPLILGHAHPEVVEAVIRAAKDGLSYGACHEKEALLAELVISGFPEFGRVRFINSGTEAVMTALRIARGVTRRDLVIKFEGGYHGHFDGMLVKAGSGLATLGVASSAGVPDGIAGTTLVAPFDDEERLHSLFNIYGDRIAAVIIEPLPANNGLLIQRKEFLTTLREITFRHGSLLIFDEVISGFRLRFGGFGQEVGIEPDLVTLGKIVGGGMPVGAVIGKANVLDSLSPVGPVYQAGTLSGNPISLAAGIATLEILKSRPIYNKLESLGALLESSLQGSGLGLARVRRAGSIVWPYFDEGTFPRSSSTISDRAVEHFKKIYWSIVDEGYYLPPSAYEVMFISDAHSPDDIIGLANTMARNLRLATSGHSKGPK